MFPPLRLREAMSLGGLTVRELAVRTWRKINDNEIMTRASAVSFYAMLAIVPFLALVLTLAVQLLPDVTGATGERGVGNMTVDQLQQTLKDLFPREAYEIVQTQIARIQKAPPVGLLSLGLVITLWSASSLFLAIIDAMNRIYGVQETRSLVKLRLLAIVMTIVQATILVGALLVIVAWPTIIRMIGLSEASAWVATVVRWIVVLVMVLLSFAMTLYIGPDADQRWEWITPGSLIGTLAFLLASLGFRVYIQNFASYDKTYGSLGGVLVLLFWFWISSLVFLTAAQINKLIEENSSLGKRRGQKADVPDAPDLEHVKAEPQAQA